METPPGFHDHLSLGTSTNNMANQIKTVGGSGTIGLQVTKEVRDAELVEEREVETDGNSEWSKEPTYRADVRVFAFDNHILVVDLDRMNTDDIAEIVSKTASATESIYRASDSSVQTKGHGYMVALPPADPEHDWECRFCDHRHRCGQSDKPYSDEGPRGFLTGFDDYPRERVQEYLQAHEDAELTPTLARLCPDLAACHPCQRWWCSRCGLSLRWDKMDRKGGEPVCPDCAAKGELQTLRLRKSR